MKVVDTVLKSLQALILLLLIVMVGSLILLPDVFGARAKKIFSSLEAHGLELAFGPDGPSLSYTRAEATEALSALSDLDALLVDAPCLRTFSCDQADQRAIAVGLGLDPESVEQTLATPDFADVWIVVVGADRTLNAAHFEMMKLEAIGFDGGLVFVDGWYRTVARFGTQEAAEEALPEIQDQLSRADAYVRLLSRWCVNHRRVESADVSYIRCEANR